MRSKWTTREAFGLHVLLLVLVSAFLALAYWQLERALHGNTLSWAYTFEWPFFAGYAVYMWWDLIHDPPSARRNPELSTSADEATSGDQEDKATANTPKWQADDGDEELAAYNKYLADLASSGKRKHW